MTPFKVTCQYCGEVNLFLVHGDIDVLNLRCLSCGASVIAVVEYVAKSMMGMAGIDLASRKCFLMEIDADAN